MPEKASAKLLIHTQLNAGRGGLAILWGGKVLRTLAFPPARPESHGTMTVIVIKIVLAAGVGIVILALL